MTLENYLDKIIKFLQESVKAANAKGLIVGLSGGIDSAVVALLMKKAFPDNSLTVLMPCFSPEIDVKYAQELVQNHHLNHKIVDLSNVFTTFKTTLSKDLDKDKQQLILGNLKARLRMSTLYALAQSNNYLVVGTDNADEWYTGYFTKYGDGGVDILPIIKLLKQDVRAAAKLLGVNEAIITRPPSASLWTGQTDEAELKFTYHELDQYLLGNKNTLSNKVVDRIEYLHKISKHKRNAIPQAPDWIRD